MAFAKNGLKLNFEPFLFLAQNAFVSIYLVNLAKQKEHFALVVNIKLFVF